MAVIKSGNSTDQLVIDAISKAARVTLYDSSGNPNSVPLATSSTGALESGGNLEKLLDQQTQALTYLLAEILKEIRIQNCLLVNGLNLHNDPLEQYQADPFYAQVDVPNG